MLSGFIIMYAHWHDAADPVLVRRYATNRIIRILPPAFVVASGWMAALCIASRLNFEVSSANLTWSVWLSSALIVPMLAVPTPVVIWTLRHEIIFYAVFLFRYVSRPLFLALLVGWSLASFALTPSPNHYFATALLLNLNVLFLFGVAAFFMWRMPSVQAFIARVGPGRLALVLSLAFFAVSVVLRDGKYYETAAPLLFGLLGTGLLLAAIPLKVPPMFERTLVFLGDASYGTYLVHFPVILILYKPLSAIGLPPALTYFVLFGAGIAAGALFYQLIEAPMTRLLRQRFSRRPAAHSDPSPSRA